MYQDMCLTPRGQKFKHQKGKTMLWVVLALLFRITVEKKQTK